MADPIKDINNLLRPVVGRLALKAAADACCVGLLGGLSAAAVLVIVSFFLPVESLPLFLAVPVLSGPVLGAAFAFVFLRPGRGKAARVLDRLGGQERAATLLELGSRDDAYARLLREDAAAALPAINVGKGICLSQPRWLLIACAALAAAILVSFAVPNEQRGILDARREARQAIQKQAEKLEAEIAKTELDEAARAELQKLVDGLKKTQTLSDALKQFSKAEESLKALSQKQAGSANDRLAKSFEGNGSTKPLADALKKKDAKEFDKKAAELAGQLKDGKLSGAEKAALQQALSAAAAGLSDKELSGALEDAAQALGSLSDGQAADALNAALKAAGNAAAGKAGSAVDAEALLKAARARLNASSPSLSGTGNGAGNGDGNGNGNGNGNGSGNGNGNGNGTGTGSGAGTGGGPDSENESADGYNGGNYNSLTNPGGVKPQGEYESVYAPDRLGGDDDGVVDGGARNESGQSDTLNAGPGQGNAGDYISYDEVVYDYREEAMQAMDREGIPAGLRQWVEKYFSSITN